MIFDLLAWAARLVVIVVMWLGMCAFMGMTIAMIVWVAVELISRLPI